MENIIREGRWVAWLLGRRVLLPIIVVFGNMIAALVDRVPLILGLAFIGAGLMGNDWAAINQWIFQTTHWAIKFSPPYDPMVVGAGLVVLTWFLNHMHMDFPQIYFPRRRD